MTPATTPLSATRRLPPPSLTVTPGPNTSGPAPYRGPTDSYAIDPAAAALRSTFFQEGPVDTAAVTSFLRESTDAELDRFSRRLERMALSDAGKALVLAREVITLAGVIPGAAEGSTPATSTDVALGGLTGGALLGGILLALFPPLALPGFVLGLYWGGVAGSHAREKQSNDVLPASTRFLRISATLYRLAGDKALSPATRRAFYDVAEGGKLVVDAGDRRAQIEQALAEHAQVARKALARDGIAIARR